MSTNSMMFPKREPFRSRALLNAANGEQCTMLTERCSGNAATVVCAHSNLSEDGKGISQKADDDISVYACYDCHYWYDFGSATKAEKQAAFDRAFVRTYKRRKAEGIIKV